MKENPLEISTEPLARRVAAGLSKIGLAMKHRAWKEAGIRRLAPLQAQTLSVLRRANQNVTVSAIAEQLAVSMPTISEVLQTLEKKGLINRNRSQSDGRVVNVTLTVKGRRKANETVGWQDFLAGVADQLPPGEQVVLLHMLVKMIRMLQERGEIPIARMCVTCRYFRPNVYADPENPHHCDYVDAPFGDRLLRIDCAEHEPATDAQANLNWNLFIEVKR